jgi:V/A-type H+-transporting ATPase subunit I
MFRPYEMRKVNIIVLNEDVNKVLDVLYDLKLIEFFNFEEKNFEKYEIDKEKKIYSDLLKIRSIISILSKFKSNNYIKSNYNENIGEEVSKFYKEYEELKEKKLFYEDEIRRLTVLKKLKLNKKDLDSNSLLIGFVNIDNEHYLNDLKEMKLKHKKVIIGDRVYFVVYNFDKDKYKLNFSFKEFYLPKKLESIDLVKEKLNKILVKIEKIKSKLSDLANKNLYGLKQKQEELNREIEINEIKIKFGKTSNITVFSGYVTKKDVKKLKKSLDEVLGGDYVLEVIKVSSDENVPVKLNNVVGAKSFEALLKMYSFPRYDELDPSFLLLLTFPVFFGFILGDVGYGLISLIFFSILKPKFSKFKDFFTILQLSSFVSILFGLFFGEFFGFEIHKGFIGMFSRIEEPQTLLLIAILFGVIHINLGLILGFINELSHSIKNAIFHKLSWIVLEVAALLLYLGYNGNDSMKVAGYVVLVLSLFMIYKGEGFIGIIEVPSFFTNILSYARLMAVGLSSVAIAILVNDYGTKLLSGNVFSIVLGILLFSIGHIFNIVLGNFEGFLHTLRLHYVEHFTKFYKGGGKEFKPFGLVEEIEE